jgi:predicted Zn-dependent peptidase
MKTNLSLGRWSMSAAAALWLLTVHSNTALGQAALRLPSGVEQVTAVEGITEYSLPNGLRVLVFPDPSRPIMTVNMISRARPSSGCRRITGYNLKEAPPSNEEVTRAKNRLLKEFELILKQSDRVGLQLSDYIGMGDWRLAFLERDGIERVTPEDVSRVARRYP